MRKVLVFNTRGQSFLGIEGTRVTVDGWCDCENMLNLWHLLS